MEYPLGQFGSAVPAMSPPSLVLTPSPLALAGGGEEVGGRDTRDAIDRTLVCYQHHSSYRYKEQHCKGCYG